VWLVNARGYADAATPTLIVTGAQQVGSRRQIDGFTPRQLTYEAQYRTNVLKSLQKKARLLGFQLVDLTNVTLGVP
jgi:hypothetical protein